MHTINVTGSAVPVSKWIKAGGSTPGGDPCWICKNCGGGEHVWGIESGKPQWVQCPDCKAIMTNSI